MRKHSSLWQSILVTIFLYSSLYSAAAKAILQTMCHINVASWWCENCCVDTVNRRWLVCYCYCKILLLFC